VDRPTTNAMLESITCCRQDSRFEDQ